MTSNANPKDAELGKLLRKNPDAFARALHVLLSEGATFDDLGIDVDYLSKMIRTVRSSEGIDEMMEACYFGDSEEDADMCINAFLKCYPEWWQRNNIKVDLAYYRDSEVVKNPKRFMKWHEAGFISDENIWSYFNKEPSVLDSESVRASLRKGNGSASVEAEAIVKLNDSGKIPLYVDTVFGTEEWDICLLKDALSSKNERVIKEVLQNVQRKWEVEEKGVANSCVLSDLAIAGRWEDFKEICSKFKFQTDGGTVWGPHVWGTNRMGTAGSQLNSLNQSVKMNGEDLVTLWALCTKDLDLLSKSIEIAREVSPATGKAMKILRREMRSLDDEGVAKMESILLILDTIGKGAASKPKARI